MKLVGLREIRKQKGYSQVKVSLDLHISREAISNYENGKRNPDVEMLLKFSDYYNVSIDYLIRGEEFTKKQRIIFPTILLAIFYGCLIILLILLNPLGAFQFDYILWTLFCGSSIIPIFYLFLLILSFAS